jgi:Ca2+-binding RTX toxin-like protein
MLEIEGGIGVESINPYNVYYGGPGNDQILGSTGNDTIYGQDGDDILNGGVGHDILAGGNGNDVLWGGSGADRFVYYSQSEGIDVIKDYSYPEGDKILVSKTGFGASSTSQFSYDFNTGALFFQGTQFVTLENKPADFSTDLGIELV